MTAAQPYMHTSTQWVGLALVAVALVWLATVWLIGLRRNARTRPADVQYVHDTAARLLCLNDHDCFEHLKETA